MSAISNSSQKSNVFMPRFRIRALSLDSIKADKRTKSKKQPKTKLLIDVKLPAAMTSMSRSDEKYKSFMESQLNIKLKKDSVKNSAILPQGVQIQNDNTHNTDKPFKKDTINKSSKICKNIPNNYLQSVAEAINPILYSPTNNRTRHSLPNNWMPVLFRNPGNDVLCSQLR